MFKNMYIKNKKVLVESAEAAFNHMASITDEVHFEALRAVCWRKEELNCSWKIALSDKEIKNKLFQLLMHRQYIAYLAEDLRQKTSQLLQLEGKIKAPTFEKEKYVELVEHSAGKYQMEKLYKTFVNEITPAMLECEKEIN